MFAGNIYNDDDDDDDGFSVASSEREDDLDFDINDITVPAQILRQLCPQPEVPEVDLSKVKEENDVKPDRELLNRVIAESQGHDIDLETEGHHSDCYVDDAASISSTASSDADIEVIEPVDKPAIVIHIDEPAELETDVREPVQPAELESDVREPVQPAEVETDVREPVDNTGLSETTFSEAASTVTGISTSSHVMSQNSPSSYRTSSGVTSQTITSQNQPGTSQIATTTTSEHIPLLTSNVVQGQTERDNTISQRNQNNSTIFGGNPEIDPRHFPMSFTPLNFGYHDDTPYFSSSKSKRKRKKKSQGQLTCEICGKRGISQEGMSIHKRVKHGIFANPRPQDNTPKFRCNTCGNVYETTEELHKHHRKRHNKLKT